MKLSDAQGFTMQMLKDCRSHRLSLEELRVHDIRKQTINVLKNAGLIEEDRLGGYVLGYKATKKGLALDTGRKKK